MCEYCEKAKPLVIGKTNDYGISIVFTTGNITKLNAYGYDVKGMGNDGLSVKIKFCPMCGRKFN